MNQMDLTGLKVMVIDDSNTIRRSAEMFLKPSGCEMILAQDGFDALSKIVDHQPNVIFVDIMMPRLDGYQTCSLIKRNPRYQNTPVTLSVAQVVMVRTGSLIFALPAVMVEQVQKVNRQY